MELDANKQGAEYPIQPRLNLQVETALEKAAQRVVQKKLGAFYTPDALSAQVTNWALDRPSMSVLEPGFGGCGFLVAAKSRLMQLGNGEPLSNIYGCDIDERAFAHLKEVFGVTVPGSNFPKIDFLLTEPNKTWPKKFDVVLGNPPYVAYQLIGENRSLYQKTLTREGFSWLSARASLWAYFVLHSLHFLRPKGRAAWVLPGSFLRADYAKEIRSHLSKSFERVGIFHVHERLFNEGGAAEETVIVLADGYGVQTVSQSLQVSSVESVIQLKQAILDWDLTGQSGSSFPSLRSRAEDALSRVTCSKVVHLEDLLSAKIGLVTGDNKFFLFTAERARAERIPLSELEPVVPKGGIAPGLKVTVKEVCLAAEQGIPSYLLSPERFPSSSRPINRYLRARLPDRIESVSTFKKRANWFCPADTKIPDAFWPVMRDLGPKLILNPSKLHCTNTLHRIFFKAEVNATARKAAAISLLTTYAQISAELVGRSYGSGVLKHEPRDVDRIAVPWIVEPNPRETAAVFKSIDSALRSGDYKRARLLADRYVGLDVQNGEDSPRPEELYGILTELRKARMPPTAHRGSERSI